jgi:N-hydroxyarylamine O-acetyltransferase
MTSSSVAPASPLRNDGEDTFDFDTYLRRIGLTREAILQTHQPLSRGLLHAVVWAHATHIPFENLSIIFPDKMRVVHQAESLDDRAKLQRARVLVSLDAFDIYRKLVLQKRGGFCFEQNLLLGRALRELGFDVTQIGARGINRTETPEVDGYALGCTTHLTLLVRTGDGKRYLVDNGIGWSGMPRSPLELREDGFEVQEEATGEMYRLVCGDVAHAPQKSNPKWGCHRFRAGMDGSATKRRISAEDERKWFLQYKNNPESEWWDIIHFREDDILSVMDCEMGAWYASTSPYHPQSRIKLVALMTAEGRYSLIDGRFTIRKQGITVEKMIESDEELWPVLEDYFGIVPGLSC